MTVAAHTEQRMLEPVARALIRKLLVPKVYFEAEWPRREQHDIVLIDRAGTGDVHVVEVRSSARSALSRSTTDRLIQVPAHFLWLAFPRPATTRDYASEALYLDGGPGRIGIIEVFEMAGDTFGANVVLPAERFQERLNDDVRHLLSSRRPDISFD